MPFGDSSKSRIQNQLAEHLSRRRENSSLRQLTLQAENAVDLSSNDFLSLATSPALKKAFFEELERNPSFRLGSGGSRLLDGNSSYALALERSVSQFHNAPTGLLFNSGFDANAGFFSCVPQSGDIVLYDEFIHASVHEGMRLSRAARTLSFKHNCVPSLCALLDQIKAENIAVKEGSRNVFVAVEALYSMDGDLCPLRDLVDAIGAALPNGNGHVIVDEAHSTGIYGSQGRGVVSSLGLEKQVFARLHTFGKAVGANGAIFLCDSTTRSYLINYARPLIYTTAMSFPSLAAIKASYSLLMSGHTIALQSHLHDLIKHLYANLQTLPLALLSSSKNESPRLQIPSSLPRSPIFSLLSSESRQLAKHCQEGGFVVRAIVAPTVPLGTERVRVCLHAGNSVSEVEKFVACIKLWLEFRAGSDQKIHGGRNMKDISLL